MANRMKERYVAEIAPALNKKFGTALAADTGLLVAVYLVADADALTALFAVQSNLASADGGLLLHDATGLALLTGLGVACSNIDLLHDDLVLAGHSHQDLALHALVLAGQDDNSIILLNVHTIVPLR